MKVRIPLSKIVVLAAGLAVIPSMVQAAPPPPDPPANCMVATLYPGMTPFNECFGGFAGNEVGANVEAMLEAELGGTWTWAGKTNAGAGEEGPFQPIDNGQVTGTLTFNIPVATSFAIALKAANNYSVYYYAFPFNQLPLYGYGPGPFSNAPPLPNSVNFNTYGVNTPNPSGNVNALSHASLYLGETVVPEPSTFILLGTGLLLLFGVERRRRKALGEN